MLLTTFDALAEFDRIAQRAFGTGQSRPGTAAIRMDAVRRPHEIELRFDLPGIDTQSLDVTVDRGVLSVSAQRNAEFAGAAAAAVAPVETAPVETAPVEAVPSEFAPSEVAPSEVAPSEVAPSEFASSEAVQSGAVQSGAVQSEAAPTGT